MVEYGREECPTLPHTARTSPDVAEDRLEPLVVVVEEAREGAAGLDEF